MHDKLYTINKLQSTFRALPTWLVAQHTLQIDLKATQGFNPVFPSSRSEPSLQPSHLKALALAQDKIVRIMKMKTGRLAMNGLSAAQVSREICIRARLAECTCLRSNRTRARELQKTFLLIRHQIAVPHPFRRQRLLIPVFRRGFRRGNGPLDGAGNAHAHQKIAKCLLEYFAHSHRSHSVELHSVERRSCIPCS